MVPFFTLVICEAIALTWGFFTIITQPGGASFACIYAIRDNKIAHYPASQVDDPTTRQPGYNVMLRACICITKEALQSKNKNRGSLPTLQYIHHTDPSCHHDVSE
ncbi:hypothetical protein DFP73DRAFT_587939 [Morchella snyderi]|nr:hypothetical protein DFP73DRAFT_587939 [Morchella snyderi]